MSVSKSCRGELLKIFHNRSGTPYLMGNILRKRSLRWIYSRYCAWIHACVSSTLEPLPMFIGVSPTQPDLIIYHNPLIRKRTITTTWRISNIETSPSLTDELAIWKDDLFEVSFSVWDTQLPTKIVYCRYHCWLWWFYTITPMVPDQKWNKICIIICYR